MIQDNGASPLAIAWRTDVLPFENRPHRQFVLVEGFREHSGVLWNRLHADVAYIRRDDQPDSILGYRAEDMDRIRRDGGMDGVEKVIGWLPAIFPHFDRFEPAPSPSGEDVAEQLIDAIDERCIRAAYDHFQHYAEHPCSASALRSAFAVMLRSAYLEPFFAALSLPHKNGEVGRG